MNINESICLLSYKSNLKKLKLHSNFFDIHLSKKLKLHSNFFDIHLSKKLKK